MKKVLHQITPILLDILPHLALVLSLMHVVFLIVDRFNRPMAFVNNDITKWLLSISALIILIICYDLHKNASKKSRIFRIALRSCVIVSILVLFVLFLDRETRIINTSTVKTLLYVYTVITAALSVCGIHHRRQMFSAQNV